MENLNETECFKRADRFSCRWLANPEPVRQVLFARKAPAIRQPPRNNILAERFDNFIDNLHLSADWSNSI